MILENSREQVKDYKLYWSEILTTDVRRRMGKTFETVSKQMTLTYPDEVPLAIGIPTSISSDNSLTALNLMFKTNDSRFSINKGLQIY